MGFARLARKYGLARARVIWQQYQEKLLRDHKRASAQEMRAAALRHKSGPAILLNDDIRPMGHFSPLTYKELHRSTLGQRGCTGGEVFDDDEYMRDFLKRHPECAPRKYVTGDIRSGYTAALGRAALWGKMERAMQHMQASQRIQSAAEEGRSHSPLITT